MAAPGQSTAPTPPPINTSATPPEASASAPSLRWVGDSRRSAKAATVTNAG